MLKTVDFAAGTVTIVRLEKWAIVKIPDPPSRAGQTWTLYVERLVSFDGVTWQKNEARAARRLEATQNLHGGHLAHKQMFTKQPITIERTHDAISGKHAVTHVPPPVILPVTEYGSTFLGRDKAKAAKHKRHLRQRVPSRDVAIAKPVHFHLCHGKKFSCSCEFKYLKRKCGDTICLHEKARQDEKTESRHGKHE